MGSPESLTPRSTEPPAPVAPARMPFWVHFGCLLAWFGMCLCFLLLQKGTALHSYFCPLRGSCDAILGSPYASLWGVSLAWFGAGYYLALLTLWLSVCGIASQLWRLRLLDCLLWLALAGLTFSLGLMYVQFAVLRAFCPLCTMSAVTVLLSALAVSQARRKMVTACTEASPRSAWMLALFASFPALILAADSISEPRSPGGIALIDLSAAHRLGSAQAPVQIVVFSDFECGYCRQLATVLHQVQAEFAPDVTIVYRHFPLEGHPHALPSAIAAECAAEQGAFWPYHDKLFAEGGVLTDARLLELAVSLGLDQQRFTVCLQSAPPRQVVEANFREAMELGLPGTPSVFINGRRLQGALTYENVVKRIKEVVPTAPGSAGAKSR